jgi:hypothetical protein
MHPVAASSYRESVLCIQEQKKVLKHSGLIEEGKAW